MEKLKLPSTPDDLYEFLSTSDNPTEAASGLFEAISHNEDARLRSMFRELTELGLIKVFWADNKPYHVNVYSKESSLFGGATVVSHYADHSVTIGAGAHIENSSIGSFDSRAAEASKKSVYERHPILCAVGVSFLVGLVLMFSFWQDVIAFLEGLI